MLDIRRLREQTEEVKASLSRKGVDPLEVDRVVELDASRRDILPKVEALQAQRNRLSREIGLLRKAGENTSEQQEQVRAIGREISALKEQASSLEVELREALLRIPNTPHPSVPDGVDETSNVEVGKWGEKPSFDFIPRAHDELGVSLGILDFERAAKISGARFVFYSGPGARLERALINFMLDLQTRENGYREMLPPYLVKAGAMVGTGNLPKFEEDLFKVDGGSFYLIPTAEVPLTNLHAGEILEEASLPRKYCAFSPCFRSEAGSYGKDTKGIIRQHQFHKIELVRFSRPEDSYEELERLTLDAESVLRALDLHYRKVLLCAGDASFSSAKTYDLEVWIPSQGRYREISSCSNFEDFQARRAGIRYLPADGGKPRFLHTLNGSGLAVGRTVVALIEQGQRADGSVAIPEKLVPYCGFQEIGPKQAEKVRSGLT